MKIILSIIFMFLTAQSLADLTGKTLLCSIYKDTRVIEFVDSSKYIEWFIIRNKNSDKYFITYNDTGKYTINAQYIYLNWHLWSGDISISRKSLNLFRGIEKKGNCQLMGNTEALNGLKQKEIELQKEYDALRRGNKI